MKTNLPITSRLRHSGKLAAFALAVLTAHGGIHAQENIVALGRVNGAGGLDSSDNTVSGVVAPVRNSAGDYTITVTAAGAFTGSDVNDFAAQATINSEVSGDTVVKVDVSSVTNNVVTLEVNVDDVESIVGPNDPVPADADFNFVLFRIPDTARANSTTSHLLASGKVDETGILQSSIGRDGIVANSALAGPGDFDISLTKAGGFATDSVNDYVILLTLEGSGAEAYAIRGDVTDVSANGHVDIAVRTDAVQAIIDLDSAVALSRGFYFSVYQTTNTPVGTVDTEALVSHARVNAAGALLSSTNSFDGGTMAATQLGAGSYRVIMTSSGAFNGRTAGEFIAHATLNQSASSDEGIAVEVTLVNSSTMQVDVSVNDLETSGQPTGVPQDAGFYLTILDTVGDVRPDLIISERRSMNRASGDDAYGRNGRGQAINLELNRQKFSKYFFALENDGNVTDRVVLKQTGRVNQVRTKYFRLTGGRQNITSQMITVGVTEESLDANDTIRYEGWVKYRSPRERPRQSIRLFARSTVDSTKVDAVRANITSGERRPRITGANGPRRNDGTANPRG